MRYQFRADQALSSTEWARPGKPEYQDSLMLEIPRERLKDLICQLVGHLNSGEFASVHFVGELTPEQDVHGG